MDYEARCANPCIGRERADLVLAGCAILEAIRRRWPCDRLRVADRGLREGVLVEMMSEDGVVGRASRPRRRRPPWLRNASPAGASSRCGSRPRGGGGRVRHRWLERQLNDPYVARARAEGFRARSAYKLIEMDDRYHLLRPGDRVVDLGAAPGGWSEVAARAGWLDSCRPACGRDRLSRDGAARRCHRSEEGLP